MPLKTDIEKHNNRRRGCPPDHYWRRFYEIEKEKENMKGNNYVLHAKNSVQLVTESQAINNALEQEKSGISPRYAFRDYKTGENLTPPGWLVWSTYEDGCGVVYRRPDGKMIVTTGFPGDFCMI